MNNNTKLNDAQVKARIDTLNVLFAMKFAEQSKQSELRILAMVKGGAK